MDRLVQVRAVRCGCTRRDFRDLQPARFVSVVGLDPCIRVSHPTWTPRREELRPGLRRRRSRIRRCLRRGRSRPLDGRCRPTAPVRLLRHARSRVRRRTLVRHPFRRARRFRRAPPPRFHRVPRAPRARPCRAPRRVARRPFPPDLRRSDRACRRAAPRSWLAPPPSPPGTRRPRSRPEARAPRLVLPSRPRPRSRVARQRCPPGLSRRSR